MENLNITDHALSKIANSWAELLPSEDIGIRTAFAHGFKAALHFKQQLGSENTEGLNNKSAFFAQYWGLGEISEKRSPNGRDIGFLFASGGSLSIPKPPEVLNQKNSSLRIKQIYRNYRFSHKSD